MLLRGKGMQDQNCQTFAFTAEFKPSAFSFMSAFDAHVTESLTAIIILMAVLLFGSVFGLPIIDILISMIYGVIILVIVRERIKPVSRT